VKKIIKETSCCVGEGEKEGSSSFGELKAIKDR